MIPSGPTHSPMPPPAAPERPGQKAAVQTGKAEPVSPLLRVQDLHVRYRIAGGKVYALQGIDLALPRGQSLGVVGESGSGKSTLGMAILRLLPPATEVEGAILLEDDDLLALPEAEMRRVRWRRVAMVFQKAMGCLSPVHRIGEQLVDIVRAHQPETTPRQALARGEELLAAVNLPPGVLSAYPHELSGGMLQRVMIAFSLVHNPQLIILDEATTALDVITQAQILQEFSRLQERFHLTTMVISHDMAVVAQLAEWVAVLYAGFLMESGPAPAVLGAPRHPYTAALIASSPRLRGPRTAISGIPGSLPDLTRPPEGCVFTPRCPQAAPACFRERPPLTSVSPHHQVACHLVATPSR